ncbi:MAG: hypothetical protein Crog4KO_29890 [Crocinitomicaceae bacterium]
MDVTSDDLVCELLEDFGEEEEDGESTKDVEDSVFFRDCYASHELGPDSESLSKSAYPENNASLHIIVLEVQTPPPKNTMC